VDVGLGVDEVEDEACGRLGESAERNISARIGGRRATYEKKIVGKKSSTV
jgi:hypothetical protein